MGFGGTKPALDPKTVACSTFKPISWSKRDTVETAKEIIEHNAAWKALCGTLISTDRPSTATGKMVHSTQP